MTRNKIDTDRIKQEHPVAEVASRYGVKLERRGKNLMGLCPLRDEAELLGGSLAWALALLRVRGRRRRDHIRPEDGTRRLRGGLQDSDPRGAP